MLENVNSIYVANAGAQSKKGFYLYKNFINRMQSQRTMQERNMYAVTVWDKIKQRKKFKKEN